MPRSADVEAVVPLRGIAGGGAEVREVATSTRGVVLVVPDGGPGLRLETAVARLVSGLQVAEAAGPILQVAEREEHLVRGVVRDQVRDGHLPARRRGDRAAGRAHHVAYCGQMEPGERCAGIDDELRRVRARLTTVVVGAVGVRGANTQRRDLAGTDRAGDGDLDPRVR